MKAAIRWGFIPLLSAAGLVIAFCIGGFYGKYFGARAGHGLGDLAYMFEGAAVGLVLGAAVGITGALRWPIERRARVLKWSVLAAASVALVTWLFMNLGGTW